MKRLTWLVGFTIVILAMPFAAWAGGSGEGGNGQKQEQRVEVREERGGDQGRRDGQRDGEKARERRGDNHERGGRRGAGRGDGWKGDGAGRGGDWRKDMLNRWMHTPDGEWDSRREGLRGHAMRMFHGIRDRAMNIHFQPEVMDSQVAVGFGNKNITAETLNININIGDVNIAGNSLDGGDAGEMIELMMKMMMKAHGQDGPGGPAGHSGMWSPAGPGMHPEMNDGDWHGMHEGVEGLQRAQFVGRDEDGRIVRYEMLIRGDEAPVEPGEVRSPYHDFYFGSGRLPEKMTDRSRNEHIVEGQPVPPHTAQQDAHGKPAMHGQLERHMLHGGAVPPQVAFWPPLDGGFEGQYDIRPEVMELAMQIPDDIPLDFIEMIFTLGRMAWEDPALAEQIREMVSAHELSEHVDKQEIRRLIEDKLRSARQDQR